MKYMFIVLNLIILSSALEGMERAVNCSKSASNLARFNRRRISSSNINIQAFQARMTNEQLQEFEQLKQDVQKFKKDFEELYQEYLQTHKALEERSNQDKDLHTKANQLQNQLLQECRTFNKAHDLPKNYEKPMGAFGKDEATYLAVTYRLMITKNKRSLSKSM